MLKKDYQLITKKLIRWIKQKVKESNTKGAVIGLSGGIDSSVTSVLCKKAFPENTLGIIMPCHSNQKDQTDARLLTDKFSINNKVINLEKPFEILITSLPDNKNNRLASANIKPRLRMTVLYYFANLNNYLVVGTGNRSELELGYFTKYGDGGVDIEPLGNLVKTEVKKIAKLLKIPKKIINKPPSAGLWENQQDEKEMELSYQEIDKYILTGEGPEDTVEKIEKMIASNKHKLNKPPVPEF